MKRFSQLLTLLVTLSVLLSACAGGAPAEEAAPADEPAAETEEIEGEEAGPQGRVLLDNVKDKGIWGTLHKMDKKLRQCYLDQLESNPELAGKIKMKLTVTDGKKISKVKKTDDTTGSEELWSCVQSTVKGGVVRPIESCPKGECPDKIDISWGVTFQLGEAEASE